MFIEDAPYYESALCQERHINLSNIALLKERSSIGSRSVL